MDDLDDGYYMAIDERDERISQLEAQLAAAEAENKRLRAALEGEAEDYRLVGQAVGNIAEGYIQSTKEANARAEAAEAERDMLRAALEMVEWVDNECPWCQWDNTVHGHHPDCARQAALDKSTNLPL